jgi:hypothetical protein
MESHDEERLMYKTTNFGNSTASYSTKPQDTALQRMALASAFFYTIPGPKMLWQFGELGYDYSINHCPDGTIKPECRLANKPIRWDYYSEPNRRELYAIISELNHLRRTNPVFSNDINHELDLSGFNKRIKLSDSNLQVVVIGNFDIQPGSVNPSFHQTGWWYNHFTRDSINVTDVNASINLLPAQWHIYTSKPLATAIGINEVEYNSNQVNAYPNPFSGELYFETSTGQTISEVTILDNLGRTVYHSKFENHQGNKVAISIPNLAKGVYIYQVETASKTLTGKIIKTQ